MFTLLIRANGAVRMQASREFESVALKADRDIWREVGNGKELATIARGGNGGDQVWFVVKIGGESDFGGIF